MNPERDSRLPRGRQAGPLELVIVWHVGHELNEQAIISPKLEIV
jgi:hypothetical protein